MTLEDSSPHQTIQEIIQQILGSYSAARQETFEQHPLGTIVRTVMKQSISQVVGKGWNVKGSIGNGNWAETPWLAIFDPQVTTSAQRGYYVVYLFDQDGRHVYLSLNQATTEVQQEFKKLHLQVLADRAATALDMLSPSGVDDLFQGPLDLVGNGALTRGYCVGNIASIRYDVKSLPGDKELVRDLLRMLSLYKAYSLLRNGVVGEVEKLPEGIKPGQEARQFRWHRRAERNKKLADDAKTFHGTTCMICSFNFGDKYGSRGVGYIEAHHIVPFAQLVKELEPVTLDPKTDFVVVCANCHRMLHRTVPAISPLELKALLEYPDASTS